MQEVTNDRAHAIFAMHCTNSATHWLDFSHYTEFKPKKHVEETTRHIQSFLWQTINCGKQWNIC